MVAGETVQNAYALLQLHFTDAIEDDLPETKLPHSFDEKMNVFRFDVRPQAFERLMTSRQMLQEDDEDTELTIRPLYTGQHIEVKVKDNPNKMGLGHSQLNKCFGPNSCFSSNLKISMTPTGAYLLMDTCSAASLVVSIGQHTLDNKIVLEATFPSQEDVSQFSNLMSPVPDANVMLLETSTTGAVLKKLVSSKLKGTLIDQLEEGKYLVEFKTAQEAKDLADKGTIKLMGHEMRFSLYEPETESSQSSSSPSYIVLLEASTASPLLKKLVSSKLKGTLIDQLGEGKYLVEFKTAQEARDLADKGTMKLLGHEMRFSLYQLETVTSQSSSSPSYTHIIVEKLPTLNAEDMYAYLCLYLSNILECEAFTSFEHSYDRSKDLFRFDIAATDITKLMNAPHILELEEDQKEMKISYSDTGPQIILKSASGASDDITKPLIKQAFGQNSPFVSLLQLGEVTSSQADIELETCSVAAKVVSIRKHRLSKGLTVKAIFPQEEYELEESGSSTEDDPTDQPKAFHYEGEARGTLYEDITDTVKEHPLPQTNQTSRTFLLSNLVDPDEMTIYYFMKALTAAWPTSILFSATGDRAIVKIPAKSAKSYESIKKAAQDRRLFLSGEQVEVKEVGPAVRAQIICSHPDPGTQIDDLTLESFLGSAKHTHISDSSSIVSVEPGGSCNGQPVYLVTYTRPEDVQSLLDHAPYSLGKYQLDAAEFYPEVGICDLSKLHFYQERSFSKDAGESKMNPVLHILEIDSSTADTLELFLSSERRTRGGQIQHWQLIANPSGKCSAQVIYEDDKVAERVYKAHCKTPLVYHGSQLKLELELPWLSEDHDDHKIAISKLDERLDSELLKMYLSALSEKFVEEIVFNKDETRAVAMFSDSINYVQLVHRVRISPLEQCPTLKVQQECQTEHLIATGSRLDKDYLEIVLESMLDRKWNEGMSFQIKELSASNAFKITSKPEALQYILRNKHRLTKCESMTPYSEFLGLEVHSGVKRKSLNLASVISDERVLDFTQNVPLGQEMLYRFLDDLGMTLSVDGEITEQSTIERSAQSNWKKLRSSLVQFIEKKFCSSKLDKLPKAFETQARQILNGRPLSSLVEPCGNSECHIIVAGEKEEVRSCEREVQECFARFIEEREAKARMLTSTIPNVWEYQIEFLNLIGFFKEMITKYDLQSFTGDAQRTSVIVKGSAQALDAVKDAMFNLLSKLGNSKVLIEKKSVFVEVFKTDVVEAMVKKQLLSRQISAVWTVEDDTILVYAEDKATAQAAANCINGIMWESLYPVNEDFDSLEREAISHNQWQEKVTELEKLYHPLVVSVLPEHARLCLAGLCKFREAVTKEIEQFFDMTIMRNTVFSGVPNRILFLQNHGLRVLSELVSKNRVTLGNIDDEGRVELSGVKKDLANCEASLRKIHDDICKELHVIEHQTMIRHINADPDFLDLVCRQTKCLVVPHKEEVIPAQQVPSSSFSSKRSIVRYSVKMPSGTICEVKKGDITSMTCDAIVNAANHKLEHHSGLAGAIVKKGGQDIQKECTDYIRRQGALMPGQNYVSKAGRLNCKRIIHAVGPRWRGGHSGEEEILQACVENLLEAAVKHKLQSVAIPPISTGIFRYPLKSAVKTIVAALARRASDRSVVPQRIIFTDVKDDSLMLFEKELKERFDAKVSLPLTQSRVSTVSSDKYCISGNKMLILNRVTVEVVEGDLVETEVDAIVNSVGTDFKLNHGKVAIALSAKAGPGLQEECSKFGPIPVGEVKVTGGHSLACKKIVHCNCPGYEGPDCLQLLQRLVVDCLCKAASYNLQSIAFPSLGTGNLGYCGKDVAMAMVSAIVEFAEKNPASSIRSVKIIIFQLDMTLKKCFEDEFSQLKAQLDAAPQKRNLNPKESVDSDVAGAASLPEEVLKARLVRSMKKDALKGCVTVNKTTIRVVQGDITDHCASVLVNSTDHLLSIRGEVSKAMVAKAGPEVKREIASLARESSTDGIWISTAGLLNADSIFHVDVGATRTWEPLITNCLRTCDANRVTSIAFPALGTGALRLPPSEMAKKLLQTIVTYVNTHPGTSLTAVDVVIFQPSMVEEFVDSMRKAFKKKESWMQKLKIFLSDWLSPAAYAEAPDPTPSASVGHPLLKMDIYGFTQADIEGCKRELDKRLGQMLTTMVWSEKACYKEDKRYIAALSFAQVQKLTIEAETRSVNVHIDQQRANIKIVGLERDVLKMAEIVSNTLRCSENEANENKEADLVAKAINWMYHNGEEMVQFSPRINKALEDLYQKTPNASYTYSAVDGAIELNLRTMTGRDATLAEFKIERIDHSKKPDMLVKVPNTWLPPLEDYHEVVLDHASAEYQSVEHNFFDTFTYNHPDWAFLPKTGKVLEVRRVQNPTLYQQYIVLRKKVAIKLGKTEEEVERVPMWHGTNEDTVSLITSGTFDRGLAGKNATKFGVGSYFATCTWYSRQDTYSKANANGHRFMIQTRVIVGEYCLGKEEFKSAPPNPNFPGDVYDSVVNNLQNPVIFVVFDDAAAYPEYIVKFSQQ